MNSLFLHSVFTTLGLTLEKKAQYAGLFHITYIVLVRGEIRINLCILLRRGGILDTEPMPPSVHAFAWPDIPTVATTPIPTDFTTMSTNFTTQIPYSVDPNTGEEEGRQTNVVTPFPTNFAETQISTTAFETSLPTYTTMLTIPTSDPPVSSPIADPQTDGPVLKCVVSVSH